VAADRDRHSPPRQRQQRAAEQRQFKGEQDHQGGTCHGWVRLETVCERAIELARVVRL